MRESLCACLWEAERWKLKEVVSDVFLKERRGQSAAVKAQREAKRTP